MKTFEELNFDQRLLLKQNILCCANSHISYDELANADDLVSDKELEYRFGGTMFSEEDF